MAPTTTTPTDLEDIERHALAGLDEERGHLDDDLDAAEREAAETADDGEGDEPEAPPVRVAAAVAFPVVAAAVMVGGVFAGIAPRVVAALAGALGVALAVAA